MSSRETGPIQWIDFFLNATTSQYLGAEPHFGTILHSPVHWARRLRAPSETPVCLFIGYAGLLVPHAKEDTAWKATRIPRCTTWAPPMRPRPPLRGVTLDHFQILLQDIVS